MQDKDTKILSNKHGRVRDYDTCENFLMSIAGHLLVVIFMITSFSLVVKRAELVVPDRIDILEIDLNNVRVSGMETKLYNTDVPKATEERKIIERIAVKTDSDNTKVEPIKDTSFVDNEVKKQPENKDTGDKKAQSDAPEKKKTIVRVNREVLSLDRTLSVSVIDALRVAMTRCWVIDTTRPDIADIRAVAHLKMNPNGMVADVWYESATRAETDAGFAYVLNTISAAIKTCEPFSMLPPGEFKQWENIQLTFYPSLGRVM